ncbi:MFS general substrate transporter [Plenodomus tracheiphilus IPT5]|uniref:MFS general substrate transporter n=1 Tax=Plenodomus tracheiphilus IPT5 TaxID=1408161 RepID=A0A6A7AU40_9PLEO|nr:MFS general substrate transporter [Plenodomus tracheiphilus IPT5]
MIEDQHEAYELTGAPALYAAAASAPIPAFAHAMPPDPLQQATAIHHRLHRQTLLKLDGLLLPFLAVLFLFNSLDKANIGNAETAHFTADIGLEKSDLNTAVALFFAFFVALQPVGAALGRRYGMVLWVPSCMLLWGICTVLHAWVQHKWQLYTLRILIGCLEAGFYPVTVTYLSLFYTRFEFGKRLSIFYGQAAIGGALGGLISYGVFSRFRDDSTDAQAKTNWRPWQILFLLEGTITMVVAVMGYFWLPHSVETAWFLSPDERRYAASRIVSDRDMQIASAATQRTRDEDEADYEQEEDVEEARGLLNASKPSISTSQHLVDDRGLSPHDLVSAVFNTKIWHILACNILSSIPVYAFSVFLPLVLAPLLEKPNPALINLLTAPPHFCGATILFIAARYSDKHRVRLVPVLTGLAIMATGLVFVVLLPLSWAVLRYLSLCVLLSGTYVASPLTVAWISGNTPSPGKRALLLGINGWGNLAGVLSALLFKPRYAEAGYIVPFWWTLGSVAMAALGYVLFFKRLKLENEVRQSILASWTDEDRERETVEGQGPLTSARPWLKQAVSLVRSNARLVWLADWLGQANLAVREGDEKITFVYGL